VAVPPFFPPLPVVPPLPVIALPPLEPHACENTPTKSAPSSAQNRTECEGGRDVFRAPGPMNRNGIIFRMIEEVPHPR